MDTEPKAEAELDISRWVLEFLLHQSLDYTLLNSLAKSLPLPPNNSYTLTKTILLSHLRRHLTTTTTTTTPSSSSLLRLLDQIQELDYLNGMPDMSQDFKAAYYVVLCANTVDVLTSKKTKGVKRKCYDEMNLMWKWRVSRGAVFKEVGLVAKEFLDWKDGVLGMMKEGRSQFTGFETVGVYVEKEMEKCSPTFLEIVAGNHSVMSLLSRNRSQDKGDLGEVSRGDEPVIEAETPGVVGLKKKVDGLITPELNESRLRDTSCSADNVVSCTDSEVRTKRRRQAKKWSREEENVLRDAVVKFGKGKWKIILYAYQHIFLERTDIDLKDKWRNLSRH